MYYFCNTDTVTNKQKIVRVTILQTDIEWARPEANRDKAWRLAESAPRSDLYVLPEMWATGFITEQALLESCCDRDGSQLGWMRLMAERFGGAVSGSLAVMDTDGSCKNRHFFVRPDGSFAAYDKRHLFAYGGEDKHYVPGKERVTVSCCGFKMLLATCYDLRFPVWLRNTDDYDAIILTANWPASRRDVWKTLLRARAIENQCFVIGANRTGSGHCGDSTVIDSKGCVVAAASTEAEQAITADLDLESQNRFRRKFPALADMDSFNLITE